MEEIEDYDHREVSVRIGPAMCEGRGLGFKVTHRERQHWVSESARGESLNDREGGSREVLGKEPVFRWDVQ